MPTWIESASALDCTAGTTLSIFGASGETNDGDLLLFYGYGNDGTGTGFDINLGAVVNTIVIRDNNATDVRAMHLAWRIADGEPTNYTFTWEGSTGVNGRGGFIARIQDFDPDNPINAFADLRTLDLTPPGDHTSPTITTTRADCLIIRFMTGGGAGLTVDGDEIAYSGPQASAERFDRSCASGNTCGGIHTENSLFSPAGVVGAGDYVIGSTGTSNVVGQTIAVAPPLVAVEFMARHHLSRRRLN